MPNIIASIFVVLSFFFFIGGVVFAKKKNYERAYACENKAVVLLSIAYTIEVLA